VGLLSARPQRRENDCSGRQSKKLIGCGSKCRKKQSSGDRKHWLRLKN
jgi:hypothetical protein